MEKNLKTKTMIMGIAIGAVAGAISAYLMIQKAESEQTTPKLSPGQGVQVGLGVLGLMRLIAGLGTD